MKMDRGELESALKSCGGFLDACAQTNLRPNVLSGKSVSLAAPGKTGQSLATRQLLVSENPNHPLHDDAMKIIEQSG